MAMPTNPTSGSNGSISAAASGGVSPYTYSINGGTYSLNSNFTGLAAGNYTITVKDANNCPGSSSQVTLSGGGTTCPNIVVSQNIDIVPTTCNANATMSVSATGGASPYTYSSNGTTFGSGTTLLLPAGAYTLVAKDANNCVGSVQVTIPSASAVISFSRDIQPIIHSGCGTVTCHNHTNNYNTYSDIVGSSTGATWSSNLLSFLKRIKGTTGTANSPCPLTTSSGLHDMPQGSSTSWRNFVSGLLTNWIDQGYPNN